MIGKCSKCRGRVISQTNHFYSDVVMRVCADCGFIHNAYRKRANTRVQSDGGRAMSLKESVEKLNALAHRVAENARRR